MRSTWNRLALIALAAVAVVSCDTRLPTATRRAAPGTPPDVVIDTPVVNTQVNLRDSILVRVQATGGNALKTLTIGADAITGVKDLGTYKETPRFKPVTVEFPAGTTDTVIRRYILPLDFGNEVLDSLVVFAILEDSLGLRDTARVRAALVSGPKVTIESPAPNDSVTPGIALSLTARATDADAINRVQIIVRSEGTNWGPLAFTDTLTQLFGGSSIDVTSTQSIVIPAAAPSRGRIVVQAFALDGNLQPGSSAPITLFVRSAASISAPLVFQTVPDRSERNEVITVVANGAGITAVGLIVRDSVGVEFQRYSIPVSPVTSNVKIGVPLQLPADRQGQRVQITAFATDQGGRTGFAVTTAATVAETDETKARRSETRIVYGQTYDLPLPGTIGDITVDASRGNVFLSNTIHNRLEVWQNGSKTFYANGIPVGSLPWGMTVSSLDPAKLLVANSGGTNISQVLIGTTDPTAMREDTPNRILTRNVYVFSLLEARDPSTGKVTATLSPVISYSDRPQYITQAKSGRIYFSTRPTAFAPEGTIRYVEPPSAAYPAPDPRIVYQYVRGQEGTEFRYTIFNVDSIRIVTAGPTSSASDVIMVWDHPYGSASNTVLCVNAPGCPVSATQSVVDVVAAMRAQQSDIEYQLRLDMTQLPLKDTTFLAASSDRNWVAFGEGNSAPSTTGARVIMINDTTPASQTPQFFSPVITVRDLTENASERVFGLALDSLGKTVGVHGLQSYFSTVDNPFHLRLQGFFDSQDNGAGIAFHPGANGNNSALNERLAFVASASGEIEIIDITKYVSRGRLTLKYPVYGPIRASRAMPGDPPTTVLKLFAATQRGLIVIDVTAGDIRAGVP